MNFQSKYKPFHSNDVWPFVRGIHWSPMNSPHQGQWRGALMFWWGWWLATTSRPLWRHRNGWEQTKMAPTHGASVSRIYYWDFYWQILGTISQISITLSFGRDFIIRFKTVNDNWLRQVWNTKVYNAGKIPVLRTFATFKKNHDMESYLLHVYLWI